MPDPVTLSAAAIGATALTEGIKFLYGQAGEVLKDWREVRDNDEQEANQRENVNIDIPKSVFEGNLTETAIRFDVVKAFEQQLRELRRDLSDYADEIDEVVVGDVSLLGKIDTLRNLLEDIYQQSITFKGENRPPSGTPKVVGRVIAREIMGEAVGVEAEVVIEGDIKGEVNADQIREGGNATGVKIATIGVKKP